MGNVHQLELQLQYSKQRKQITTVHGWPWTSEACLPISSSVPQLPLHPPRHLSLMSSLSYLGRDDPNSREKTLSLGSNNAGAEQSLVLAIDDAELPLQLRPASWSTEVIHPAVSADLNQLVDIFAAVAQSLCNETQSQ